MLQLFEVIIKFLCLFLFIIEFIKFEETGEIQHGIWAIILIVGGLS